MVLGPGDGRCDVEAVAAGELDAEDDGRDAERDADGFYRRMGLSAVGAFGLTAFIRTRDK